jgi:hypothetical protein
MLPKPGETFNNHAVATVLPGLALWRFRREAAVPGVLQAGIGRRAPDSRRRGDTASIQAARRFSSHGRSRMIDAR